MTTFGGAVRRVASGWAGALRALPAAARAPAALSLAGAYALCFVPPLAAVWLLVASVPPGASQLSGAEAAAVAGTCAFAVAWMSFWADVLDAWCE